MNPYNTYGLLICDKPANWDLITRYANDTYKTIEDKVKARPDNKLVKKALDELLINIQFQHCYKNNDFIQALGLNVK